MTTLSGVLILFVISSLLGVIVALALWCNELKCDLAKRANNYQRLEASANETRMYAQRVSDDARGLQEDNCKLRIGSARMEQEMQKWMQTCQLVTIDRDKLKAKCGELEKKREELEKQSEEYWQRGPKRTLIITRGIPASGKSTWAMGYATGNSLRCVRICKDDIRNMLGEYWVPAREPLVEKMAIACLLAVIWNSDYKTIVLDGTNFNEQWLNIVKEAIQTYNYSIFGKHWEFKIEYMDFFDTPLEECIERDKQRAQPRGESVIRDFYERYKDIITLTKENEHENSI